MQQKEIIYFGQKTIITCDDKCEKAWGTNVRSKFEDGDKIYLLADDELGTAPIDPGTYEGSDGKPLREGQKLNRWCCRECERCKMTPPGEEVVLPDFSKRVKM